jgi:hypothetical protein
LLAHEGFEVGLTDDPFAGIPIWILLLNPEDDIGSIRRHQARHQARRQARRPDIRW